MKNRKCPNHRACWDYGSCEDCELGKEITRLHKRIDRLKNQKETLTITRNAWERLARSYEAYERNKWIPVDERLPEKEGTYLIFTDIHFIPDHVDDCDHYEGVEVSGFSPDFGFVSNNGIYAKFWMPLPEPPKESEGSENG